MRASAGRGTARCVLQTHTYTQVLIHTYLPITSSILCVCLFKNIISIPLSTLQLGSGSLRENMKMINLFVSNFFCGLCSWNKKSRCQNAQHFKNKLSFHQIFVLITPKKYNQTSKVHLYITLVQFRQIENRLDSCENI